MPEKLTNIPTNLVMGFLGVGKTTAILDLLKQKPKKENWAVLVNEFGQVGIDGAIFKSAGATVKEIAGGCLCCAVALPFQTSINRLLIEARPDRLLIEPTGLGHPKKVLDMLVNGVFKDILDVRASICLVDPEKLKDTCYTTHENFIDQIALSDVLVANKMDLADREAIKLFHQWIKQSRPPKTMATQTILGQLDIAWLDVVRNPQRRASFPNAHKITKISTAKSTQNELHNEADGFQSFAYIYPAEICFDYVQLNGLLKQLKVARIKAIFFTNKGWFIINGAEGILHYASCSASTKSRIEIIAAKNHFQGIANELQQCKIEDGGI